MRLLQRSDFRQSRFEHILFCHRSSAGNLLVVAGLALGGVIAAPFAAWLVSRVPATLLGTAVGGVIVLTNAQKLFKSFDITGAVTVAGYLAILGAWAALLFYAWKRSTLTPAEAEGDFTGVIDTPGGGIVWACPPRTRTASRIRSVPSERSSSFLQARTASFPSWMHTAVTWAAI